MPTLATYTKVCPGNCYCPDGQVRNADGWVVRNARCLNGTWVRTDELGRVKLRSGTRTGIRVDHEHRERVAFTMRQERQTRGLTRKQLSVLCGVETDRIGRWERGDSPMHFDDQRLIERRLGLPYGELS